MRTANLQGHAARPLERPRGRCSTSFRPWATQGRCLGRQRLIGVAKIYHDVLLKAPPGPGGAFSKHHGRQESPARARCFATPLSLALMTDFERSGAIPLTNVTC